ncbi:MAG: NADH-quinone oxidoreductase subunit NuoH [Pseudomonadota bacterium]
MILFDPGWLGSALRIVLVFTLVFGLFVNLLVYGERKVSAFMQDRIGPNRVGPFGVLQPIADAIKFLFKEEVRPAGAHPILYPLAPMIAVVPAVLVLAIIPLGARRIGGVLHPLQIADLDLGLLFALAISSLSVYGIIIGGWASNSKYPLLGTFRAAAQMISYEIPQGMVILSVFLLAGSARLADIVAVQNHVWFVFLCPLGFLLFFISMFAETNRLPFDLPEGDSEIIGYHTEYSSMKFASYFMAEYANMFTVSCLMALLFFGGWEFLPFFGWDRVGEWLGVDVYADPVLWLLPSVWFLLKVTLFLFVFIWVRWTLPRFRYDQLMRLGWKRLVPLSLLNLLLTVAVAWKAM